MSLLARLKRYRFWTRKNRGLESVKGRKKAARRLPRSELLMLLGILGIWGVGAFNIIYRPNRNNDEFVPGQRASVNIYAQVDFEYVDQVATRIRRRRAANNVPSIYRIDSAADDVTLNNFTRLFAYLKSGDTAGKIKIPHAPELPCGKLSAPDFDALQFFFDSADKRNFFITSLKNRLSKGIIGAAELKKVGHRPLLIIDELGRRKPTKQAELATPESAVKTLFRMMTQRFATHSKNRQQVYAAVQANLVPLINTNLTFAAELTAREQERAAKKEPEVRRLIQQGTLFLPQGHTVTQDDLAKIKAHQLALEESRDSNLFALHVVSLLLLNALIIGFLVLAFCLFSTAERVPGHIVLVSLILIFNLLLLRGTEEVAFLLFNTSRFYLFPALPLGLTAILTTLLLGPAWGLFAGGALSLTAAVQWDESMHILILGLISSGFGVMAVASARTRTQTIRGAFGVALGVMAVQSIYMFRQLTPPEDYLYILGIAVTNGLGIVMIANLILPFTEAIFGLCTPMNLLELSDLNHPLLKRLQMEAPGTYHHTLMVATLAEHAAEAVGANTLLARVASYFHDVGKLANPTYFTENSAGADRHEDLSPRMSAMIIINHVKEGLALARKHKLKLPIREVIQSHHGDSVVFYFYHRAVEQADGEAVSEDEFRYPGKLPRSREASIICLADSCEAASRSLAKPTPQKIEALVRDIVRQKLLQGQLAESALTMHEITAVETCLIHTLRTMLHGRIAYPRYPDENSPQ